MVEERPVCECHGEPQRWRKNSELRAGGKWECVVTLRERQRKWRAANRDKVSAYNRRYRETHLEQSRKEKREYMRKLREEQPELVRERENKWRKDNAEKVREMAKRTYQKHREETLRRVREYRINNNEEVTRKQRERWHANLEKNHERQRLYRESNPEKVAISHHNQWEKRYYSDKPEDRMWVQKRNLYSRRIRALARMKERQQRRLNGTIS